VYVLTSIATKNIAQVNINLKISRRVNANASPDVAKPLYQREGGCASFPLIQSFACTDSARALRRTGSPIEENVYRNMEMVTKMIILSVPSNYLFTWIGDEHQVSKFKL
jgi:hypothetical protein